MTRPDAQSRYRRDVLIASTVYGVALFGGGAWFRHHAVGAGAISYLVALVPGVAIAAIFVLIGRYLAEEGDEYLRMLMVRQALIASGIALTVATLWGFLEAFGLVAHLPMFWIAIVWFGGLAVGRLVNRVAERG